MIEVLVVDDHAVVRAGLSKLLSSASDIEVVGAAANGADAVEIVAARSPDVILMDLSMPEVDGIEATRLIREREPEARIVVLTSFSDRERILEAIDAGAIGYLLKDAEPALLGCPDRPLLPSAIILKAMGKRPMAFLFIKAY